LSASLFEKTTKKMSERESEKRKEKERERERERKRAGRWQVWISRYITHRCMYNSLVSTQNVQVK